MHPSECSVVLAMQEVTSKKDQKQFWKGKKHAYRYVSVPELAASFKEFHIGQRNAEMLAKPAAKTDRGVSLISLLDCFQGLPSHVPAFAIG